MNALKPHQLEEFINGYMTAALWSSSDTIYAEGEDSSTSEGEHVELDQYDWAEGEEDKRREECLEFIKYAGLDLHRYYKRRYPQLRNAEYTVFECAGHDFWLTRAGHGVGFWDRGLGELGARLTEKANTFGNIDLYLGDDQLVHS